MTNPWVLFALIPLLIQSKEVGLFRLSIATLLIVLSSFLAQDWLVLLVAIGIILCLECQTEKKFTLFKAGIILMMGIWLLVAQDAVWPLAILCGMFPFHIFFRDIFMRLKPALVGSFGFLYLFAIFEPISHQNDFSTWLLVSGIYHGLLSFAQKDIRGFMCYRMLALFGLVAAQGLVPHFLMVLWLIEMGIWLCSEDGQGRFMSKEMSKASLYLLFLCGLFYLPIWPIYDSFFANNTVDWFRLLLISLLAFGSFYSASRALARIQDRGNT